MWITVTMAAVGSLTAVILVRRANRRPALTLRGAVIRQAAQADKELPVSDVEIAAGDGLVTASCKSDSSGFFKLTLPGGKKSNQPITLRFQRRAYWPLDLKVTTADRLYVAKMVPKHQQQEAKPHAPEVTVSNISVRYSVKTTTMANVGSSVKTFQVANLGNVPCKHQEPCSPDGKWKAAIGSISLGAGKGNVFHDARVSCIAGPCPFTKIMPQSFSGDSRTLSVEALNWSDTATFLLEAEVFHPMVSAEVRKLYPVMFGRVLHFTVPPSAEGVCIEADIGGSPIIFPLGPKPGLQWADCHISADQNKSVVYRCELAPGYRF